MQLTTKFPNIAIPQPLPDQRWLEKCSEDYLDTHHVIIWLYNPKSQHFDGFEVIGEGGLVATVTLAERGM